MVAHRSQSSITRARAPATAGTATCSLVKPRGRAFAARPPLVQQPLESDETANPRHQVSVLDRLGQKIVCAGFQPA